MSVARTVQTVLILTIDPISQCQEIATPIARQLLDGVRYLDVRLRVVKDELLSECERVPKTIWDIDGSVSWASVYAVVFPTSVGVPQTVLHQPSRRDDYSLSERGDAAIPRSLCPTSMAGSPPFPTVVVPREQDTDPRRGTGEGHTHESFRKSG